MGFDIDELLSESRLMEALESTERAEASLRDDKKPGAQKQKNESAQTKKGPPAVLFWEIAFDVQGFETLRKLWAEHSDTLGGSTLKFNEDAHITLLYIGGQSVSELAKKNPELSEKGITD